MNQPSYEEALQFMADALVHQRIDLTGQWQGWRLCGRELVAPHGQRITPQRLEGLLWRDELELRRAGFASRRKAESDRRKSQMVKVVVIPLSEVLEGRAHGAA